MPLDTPSFCTKSSLVEDLHKSKKFLLKLLDEKYIVRDEAFCREYLDEPPECRNLPDRPIDWRMAE